MKEREKLISASARQDGIRGKLFAFSYLHEASTFQAGLKPQVYIVRLTKYLLNSMQTADHILIFYEGFCLLSRLVL